MSWRKLLSSSIAVCPPWPYQSKFPFGEFSTLVDTGCTEGDAVISRSQGRRISPWDSWTTTQQAKSVIEKVQFNIKITQKIHVMFPHWLVLPELLLTKLHEISVFQVRPDLGEKKKSWNTGTSHKMEILIFISALIKIISFRKPSKKTPIDLRYFNKNLT